MTNIEASIEVTGAIAFTVTNPQPNGRSIGDQHVRSSLPPPSLKHQMRECILEDCRSSLQ